MSSLLHFGTVVERGLGEWRCMNVRECDLKMYETEKDKINIKKRVAATTKPWRVAE
jgi:hypothetical protein